MEVQTPVFIFSLIWLSTSCENYTTESIDIPTTNPPEDNGMTLDQLQDGYNPPTAKEQQPSAIEQQPIITFPDNHKNFTPSQYLVDEFPPYHNYLNPYQQQYKNYFEQKQIYNRKPIKFEENLYLPPSAEDEKKTEDPRNPFPYVYDTPKSQPEPIRQDSIIPYYVYHGYPQQEKYKSDYHVKKEGNPWKKVFHILSALVPLGLILATLTPNVISINSTAATKTRQRSEDLSPFRFKEEDVMKLMKRYGVDSLKEAQCEDRIICELAVEGGNNVAGPIEKGFWFLANQTPWDIAEQAGMSELFKAIKTGSCDLFKCHKSGLKTSLGKKLIRKHKITT